MQFVEGCLFITRMLHKVLYAVRDHQMKLHRFWKDAMSISMCSELCCSLASLKKWQICFGRHLAQKIKLLEGNFLNSRVFFFLEVLLLTCLVCKGKQSMAGFWLFFRKILWHLNLSEIMNECWAVDTAHCSSILDESLECVKKLHCIFLISLLFFCGFYFLFKWADN